MNSIPFETLGVSQNILRSLSGMGFTGATPVQEQAIGPFLEGHDLTVQAPTGTGKTLAFGIPILQKLDVRVKFAQALILSPTRELALQIAGVLKELARHTPGVRVATVYGGENIERQFAALRGNPHIIVATPGRLLDHMQRGTVKLHGLRIVVLDEADRMLDMGFRADLKRILSAVPKQRQTVMFSATFSGEVKAIADEFQKNAQHVEIRPDKNKAQSITQYSAEVGEGMKNDVLFRLLKQERFPLALVFVNTKRRADRLAKQLKHNGWNAAPLHGDMSQNQRERVMKQYRNGELAMLVATDVAARGIDVYDIDVVINYDIPQDDDSYIHRIGRTGRADKTGVAYTFLYRAERQRMQTMARKLHLDIRPVPDALTEGLKKPAQITGTESAPTVRQTDNTGKGYTEQSGGARKSRPAKRMYAGHHSERTGNMQAGQSGRKEKPVQAASGGQSTKSAENMANTRKRKRNAVNRGNGKKPSHTEKMAAL